MTTSEPDSAERPPDGPEALPDDLNYLEETIRLETTIALVVDPAREPPVLGAKERRELARRVEGMRLSLWAWHRALKRSRSAVNCIRAALLAPAIVSGCLKPRDVKRSVIRLDAFSASVGSGALLESFGLLGNLGGPCDARSVWRTANYTVETGKAKNKLSGNRRGHFDVELTTHEILRDAAQYALERERGTVEPIWFCPGCDEWHGHEKGARPRHGGALRRLVWKVADRGGLRRGDAKRIYQKFKATTDLPVPSLSWFYKFVKAHHLDRVGSVRRVAFRQEDGRWCLYRYVQRVL